MMDEETIAIYASNLVIAYKDLAEDLADYVHDPAEHNLCMAVVRGYPAIQNNNNAPQPTFERHFVSYSAPRALPKRLQEKYRAEFIPPNNPHGSLFTGDGMAYLHTEVRLLNFLWANRNVPEIMPFMGQIYFFSTRSICTGCSTNIGLALPWFSKVRIALIPYELQAEKFRGNALDTRQVYMFLARKGTGGQKREGSTDVTNRA